MLVETAAPPAFGKDSPMTTMI
ncbi:DUF4189 domain-containing protein, partial [Mycobacterium tuberculosis]